MTDQAALRAYTPQHLADKILKARSALEGERKPVTVLFCDIADSTVLADRLGPERMHAVLNAFFEAALAEVHRYEGTVNQFLGDGFMALFGAPLSHEDHARRAVLAALAIRDAPAAECSAACDSGLQLRMGLNSGAVVVGRIGDNLRMDYTAVGDTTNVAARIQDQAEPGSILVSDSVWRSTQAYAQFRALGTRVLKGKTAPLPIYELVAAHAVQGAQRRDAADEVAQALVGRQAEVAVIAAALERLRASGQGGVIGLVGDAGLGKSRLLEETRRRALGSGLRWLQGDCLSFGRTLSYWSFREVIRRGFGIDERDDEAASWRKVEVGMRELFAEQADELLPYLGTLLAVALPAPLAQRIEALDSHAIGHQIFRATLLMFERSARQRPLVVAFEDWHWADASSSSLLEHVLPLSDRVPILFVIASRREPQGPAERFRIATSRQADPPLLNAHVLELAPLPVADSVQLAERLLGGGALSRHLRDMLLKRAEGNPFYLGELARTLLATKAIERDDAGEWRTTQDFAAMPLPDTIEGLILARIDRLEDEVKQVLKAAAVIGRTFFYRVLEAVAQAGSDLDADIAKLRGAELIDEKRLAPELEYVFKHPLIQQATYDSLLEDRRRQMHRLVGQSIETLFEGRLEPFHSMLAYHYARAEDAEKASEYLFKAADQADRLAADEEALELYNAVIADAERSPLRGLSAIRRAELEMKIGDAHFRAGRHHLALEALSSAARRLGHAPPRSRIALGVAVAIGMLTQWARPVLSRWSRTETRPVSEIDATACRVWETMAWIHFFTDQLHQLYDCLRIVQITRRDPTVRSHTIGLGTMGVVFSSIGAYPTARWFHERARETAQTYCDPATQAHALFFEGMSCQADGRWQRAIEVQERARELSWTAGDIRVWASTMTNLFISLHRIGQPRMFEVAERLERVVNEAADRHAQAWSLTVCAMVHGQRGSYREALDVLERAVAVCRDIPEHRALAHALGLRCGNLRRLNRLEEAELCGAEAVQLLKKHRLTGIFSTVPLMEYADVTLALLQRSPLPKRVVIDKAANAVRQALRQGRRVHDEGPVESQRIAAEFKLLCGDVVAAREAWACGLRRSEELGTIPARARILEARGRMCRQPVDLEEARRLYDAIRENAASTHP
ncbi:MAG TPA: adenylate/guanylate cyclase domain-containing protein [Caldimonas sp.]|jgi:class 3 adenylate cyclase/tetratricopeptide (TPR) repeat protein